MTITGQVQALIKVNLKSAELITEYFNGPKNCLKNRQKIAKHQPPNHNPKCPQNRPSLNQSAVILPRKRNFIIVPKIVPKVAPCFNYILYLSSIPLHHLEISSVASYQ